MYMKKQKSKILMTVCCLLPKSLMDRAGFRVKLQGWTVHLNRSLGMGEHFAAGEQQMVGRWARDFIERHFAQGVNDASHISPVDRAGTHGAWLGAGVQRTGCQLFF
jgi:hypothetical protein